MALEDDILTANAALVAVLDSLAFLDPGLYGRDDPALLAEVEADVASLAAAGVALSTTWLGEAHEPTAMEMIDWLFDGYPPAEHRLTVTARPGGDGAPALVLTTDVPFPWR